MVNTQVPSEVGENQLNLVDAETNLSRAIEQQTDEWVFNYLRTRFINILTNPMDVENDSRAFSTVLYMIQFIKEKAIREAVNNAFLDACRTEGGSLKKRKKRKLKKQVKIVIFMFLLLIASISEGRIRIPFVVFKTECLSGFMILPIEGPPSSTV